MPLASIGKMRLRRAQILFAAAGLGLALAAGCGKPAPADNLGPKMSGAAKKPETAAADATVADAPKPVAFVSTFGTNDFRDPFNPKSKPKTPESAANQAAAREAEQKALIKALSSGFQGIYGTDEVRELVLHGALLREKRDAVLTLPVNGEPRRIKFKVLRINRTTAELQVEGVPTPVTLPQSK